MKNNYILNETDQFEVADNTSANNMTNAENAMMDGTGQNTANPYDPNAVQDNTVQEIEQMSQEQQVNQNVLDFEIPENYKNAKLFNLFNDMIEIAIRLKTTFNDNIDTSMIKQRILYGSHNIFTNLDKFIEDAKFYSDNAYEYNNYQKNLYTYLTYRNSFLTILKEIKKHFEV